MLELLCLKYSPARVHYRNCNIILNFLRSDLIEKGRERARGEREIERERERERERRER